MSTEEERAPIAGRVTTQGKSVMTDFTTNRIKKAFARNQSAIRSHTLNHFVSTHIEAIDGMIGRRADWDVVVATLNELGIVGREDQPLTKSQIRQAVFRARRKQRLSRQSAGDAHHLPPPPQTVPVQTQSHAHDQTIPQNLPASARPKPATPLLPPLPPATTQQNANPPPPKRGGLLNPGPRNPSSGLPAAPQGAMPPRRGGLLNPHLDPTPAPSPASSQDTEKSK